jgi:hypothetical protein
VSPPPPSTSWVSAAPPPLLNAGVVTCCSYLLAACMRVRSGGGASGNSPRVVRWRGPRIGGREMQVCGGDKVWPWASVRTSGR